MSLLDPSGPLFGGGQRPRNPYVQVADIPEQYFNGLNPEFATRLRALDAAAPPGIFENIGAISGYRSDEHQARLWASALERYGSEAEARQWVAPPGRSNHGGAEGGHAVDLSYGNDAAREWVHANAAQHGLHFPMSWENWHIEPTADDGGRVTRSGPPVAHAHDPSRPPSVFNPPTAGSDDATTSQADETIWDRLAGISSNNPYFGGLMAAQAPVPVAMAPPPQPQSLQAPRRDTITPYLELFSNLRG